MAQGLGESWILRYHGSDVPSFSRQWCFRCLANPQSCLQWLGNAFEARCLLSAVLKLAKRRSSGRAHQWHQAVHAGNQKSSNNSIVIFSGSDSVCIMPLIEEGTTQFGKPTDGSHGT